MEEPLNERCLAVGADQVLRGSGDPEFFLRMVAGSADRFAYLDRGLVYRAANAAYLKSREATADELIGHSVEDVLDRDDYEEVRPKLEACLAGKTVVYEAQLPGRGAQTGWGEVTYRPWLSVEGMVEGIVVCVHDITARKAAQFTIERLTRLYRTLSECNQAILHCERVVAVLNVYAQDPDILDENARKLLSELVGDVSNALDHFSAINQSTHSDQNEHRVHRQDRRHRWILDRGKIVKRAADGTPMRMVGTDTDITARRDALLRLGEIVDSSQTEVYVFDPETLCFEQVNQGARANLGYSMDELALMTPLHLKPDYDAQSFARLIEPLRKGTKTQLVLETRHRRKDGSCYPAEIRLQLLGRPPRFLALVTDVAERQRAEEAIKHLAFVDPLTGLPNRRLLSDRLEHAVASTRRSDRFGALVFIDLDDFKTLNDTLGHGQGDLLLRQVAKRLLSCIRETDTLARLGGDEFVVVLERLSDVAEQAAVQAEAIGNKMLNALREPWRLEGLDYRCSASMGLTLFGRSVVRVEELMTQADLAMYRAKAAGRDTLCFFDHTMQAEVTARAALAANFSESRVLQAKASG
jgi:diguanylate cyclase (GGDEF)-like protein/PAS domain S-box-containing protein